MVAQPEVEPILHAFEIGAGKGLVGQNQNARAIERVALDQLDAVAEMADAKLRNDGSLEELHAQIQELLDRTGATGAERWEGLVPMMWTSPRSAALRASATDAAGSTQYQPKARISATRPPAVAREFSSNWRPTSSGERRCA